MLAWWSAERQQGRCRCTARGGVAVLAKAYELVQPAPEHKVCGFVRVCKRSLRSMYCLLGSVVIRLTGI